MVNQSRELVEVLPSSAGREVEGLRAQHPSAVIPAQAASDAELLRLWLDGKARHTVRAYEGDARAFLAHTGKELRVVTLGDVQGYGGSLARLPDATQARKLGAVVPSQFRPPPRLHRLQRGRRGPAAGH